MNKITMAHGSGGRAMHSLIGSVFMKELANDILLKKGDSAVFNIGKSKLAFTTDSYVVKPIFFPGGDIGSLAVHGTVNDLAVCGAKPLYISLAIIMEEGFGAKDLSKIVMSIKKAAGSSGVKVVTGDTKVVERGSCDKIFINTSGVGEIYYPGLSADKIKTGDAVIVSGPIGDHAISVISKREGISFGTKVKSDSASLLRLIRKALGSSREIRFMRDPTRGGLATTLNEITSDRSFGIALEESQIPVSEGVREACELLGFDPLYLACEGRAVIVVSAKDTGKVLRAVKSDRFGRGAAIVGRVTGEYKGKVYINTRSGGKRLVDMLSGEQLPRIC